MPNYIIHQKYHHKITQELLTKLPLFLTNYVNPSEIPSQNHSKLTQSSLKAHSQVTKNLPLFLPNYVIHQKYHHKKITQRYKKTAIVFVSAMVPLRYCGGSFSRYMVTSVYSS